MTAPVARSSERTAAVDVSSMSSPHPGEGRSDGRLVEQAGHRHRRRRVPRLRAVPPSCASAAWRRTTCCAEAGSSTMTRSHGFDLTEKDDCHRLYEQAPECRRRHPPRGGGGRHRRQPREPGALLLRQHGDGPAPHRAGPRHDGFADRGASSCRSGPSAPTPSSRPCRSRKRTSGTGTPRRPTRPTASRRRPRGRCSTPTSSSTA
jgi:hypothetical protein